MRLPFLATLLRSEYPPLCRTGAARNQPHRHIGYVTVCGIHRFAKHLEVKSAVIYSKNKSQVVVIFRYITIIVSVGFVKSQKAFIFGVHFLIGLCRGEGPFLSLKVRIIYHVCRRPFAGFEEKRKIFIYRSSVFWGRQTVIGKKTLIALEPSMYFCFE